MSFGLRDHESVFEATNFEVVMDRLAQPYANTEPAETLDLEITTRHAGRSQMLMQNKFI
jgi:hypothetical protein